MKFPTFSLRHFFFAAALILALCQTNQAWSKPKILSIEVLPDPLNPSQDFTIEVATSPDVTEAFARVDFHPGQPRAIEIPLAKQGSNWTGVAAVPRDLQLQLPGKAGGIVKITVFDAQRHRAEGVNSLSVDLTPVPVVSAVFRNGILTVTGDDRDNKLTVSRDTAGNLFALSDGQPLAITGRVPNVTNTTLIRIAGLKGNDVLLVEDFSGPMPPANLLGGEGDDTLTGSASDDVLDGGLGNDTLFGRDGKDILLGGPGNDFLDGGRGDDQLFGGEGDDQIVWNPGDGSDLVEGENGQDTLLFNGSNIGEIVDLTANGQRLRFTRNVGGITMDCNGVERVAFRALGGADEINVHDLTGTQVTQVLLDLSSTAGVGDAQTDKITINGTETNDVVRVISSETGVQILGLSAQVVITASEPTIDQLVISGRGGLDTVDFEGVTTNQVVDFSPNGQALRFFSSVSPLIMECQQVEQVSFHALGAAEQITINDLTGTTVTQVGIDLSGNTPGTGDGQAQTIVVNGTELDDRITLTGSAAGVNVVGLAAAVTIVGAEGNLDNLVVNARGGADVVDASAVQAGLIDLTLNGGAGIDILTGSAGSDLLIGGQGNDVIFGGPGDDTFVWNPGDGSDVLEGDSGQDTMVFNGANISEKVVLSANGQRLRFTRDVAAINMDCAGIEAVRFNALGGGDTITVNDLTGTAVTRVHLDLAGVPDSGTGDNNVDNIIVDGTAGSDVVTITGSPGGVSILGLSAIVTIVGTDPTLDQLMLRLLAGDDLAEASGLPAGVINLILDGGLGADVLVGSAGADTLLGGEGDDVLEGEPGQDVLDGGPGDNVLIQ
jgi:Ca2+-binding RTX toxin-like protein